MRYFIYARKSTDDDDRQVLSIEGQLVELRQYAQREGLTVVSELVGGQDSQETRQAYF